MLSGEIKKESDSKLSPNQYASSIDVNKEFFDRINQGFMRLRDLADSYIKNAILNYNYIIIKNKADDVLSPFVKDSIKIIDKELWPDLFVAIQSNNWTQVQYILDGIIDNEINFLNKTKASTTIYEQISKTFLWFTFKIVDHVSRAQYSDSASTCLNNIMVKYVIPISVDKYFEYTSNEVYAKYITESECRELSSAIAHNDFKLADQLLNNNKRINFNMLFECRIEEKLTLDKFPLNLTIDYICRAILKHYSPMSRDGMVSLLISSTFKYFRDVYSTETQLLLLGDVLKVSDFGFVATFFEQAFEYITKDNSLKAQLFKLPLFRQLIAGKQDQKWIELFNQQFCVDPTEIVLDNALRAKISSKMLNEITNVSDNISPLFRIVQNPQTINVIIEDKEFREKITPEGLNAIVQTGEFANSSPLYWLAKCSETCRLLYTDDVLCNKIKNEMVFLENKNLSKGASLYYWLTKHAIYNNYRIRFVTSQNFINTIITEGNDKGFSAAYWMLFNPRIRRDLLQNKFNLPAEKIINSFSAETLNAVIPQGIWKGTTAAFWLINTESGRLLLEQYPELRKKVNDYSSLEYKLDYNILGLTSETHLYNAAAQGHVAILEKLLNDGWDVNLPSQVNGYTPLMAAAEYGNEESVKILLTHSANICAQTYKHNALSLAAVNNHTSVIKQLVEAKLDPNFLIGNTKLTALHWAVLNEHINAIQSLIDFHAYLEALDADGTSPLDWAIRYKKLAAIVLLLKNGAFIRNPKELHNFLENADQRDPNTVYGLEFLANHLQGIAQIPNDFTEEKRCQIIAYAKKLRMLHELVNTKIVYTMSEVSLNFIPNPLLNLVESYHENHLEQYNVELFKPENVDEVIKKLTIEVLHNACRKGQQKLIVKLKKNTVDANVVNAEGQSGVHIAAAYKNASLIPALHFLGASLNQLDAKHQTAAHIAVTKRDALFINELRKLNADFHIPNAAGKTALSSAIESKQWDMAAYMLLATDPAKQLNEIESIALMIHKNKLCDSVIALLKNMGSMTKAHRSELVESITQKKNKLGIILESKKSHVTLFTVDYFSKLEKELILLDKQSLKLNNQAQQKHAFLK